MKSNQVFAKVILCGEHSVLRGGAAVVAPLKTKSLDFEIEHSDFYELNYTDETAPYEILIEGTLEKALKVLGKNKEDLKVKILLKTLVPLGRGLGGSAALSVFVSRVMKFLSFIEEERIFSFSVELENMFHGESSGVDIAGCLSESLHLYVRGEALKKLKPNISNLIFGLVDTGDSGDTEECIERVLKLKKENKNLFYELDSNMDEASKMMAKALENGETDLLVKSFDLANSVFESWGLVTPSMKELTKDLKDKGALAVKPTGSGMGGYVLSIWNESDRANCGEFCTDVFNL